MFKRNMKNVKKVRSNLVLCSSEVEASELCEVTSTTDNTEKAENNVHGNFHPSSDASASVQNSLGFIPLLDIGKRNKWDKNRFNHQLRQSERNKDEIITVVKSCSISDKNKNDKSLTLPSTENEIEDDEIVVIERPVSNVVTLRPVVIDGSNVARAHGKVSNCFSGKGIKIAVDYFVNRGHAQVTAFLPMFRRHFNPKHSVPTKDTDIIEELAKKQFIVFTPSRWLNGKCIQSYDDRFIVQLAAKNGGVIVSNDNYRDLLTESDSFREAIEQRLLMYCFVGDEFMVPEDPLGRNGPKLDKFLCFPPKSPEK